MKKMKYHLKRFIPHGIGGITIGILSSYFIENIIFRYLFIVGVIIIYSFSISYIQDYFEDRKRKELDQK